MRIIWRNIFLALVFTFFVCSLTAASKMSMNVVSFGKTVHFTTSSVPVQLMKFSRVYASRENFTILQATSKIASGQIAAKKPRFDDFIWVCFTVENAEESPLELFLDIDNAKIAKYELFEIDSSDYKLLGKGGEDYPFNYRKIKNRRFLEPISLNQGEQKYFTLLIDDRDRDTNIPLLLWEKNDFNKKEARMDIFYNLYFGGLLFIGVFSLVIGFVLRLNVFYTYGIYAFVMASVAFTFMGFGYQLVYPNAIFFQKIIDILMILPLLSSFSFFTASYFNLKKLKPQLYKWVKIHGLACALVAGVWLVTLAKLPMKRYIQMNYVMIVTFFVLIVFIIRWAYKEAPKKFLLYALAFLSIMAGGTIMAFTDAGVIPQEFFPTNTLLMGSVFEFGIFTIALVFEVKSINETKNKLLVQSAEQRQKLLTAFVEGAEKERTRLSGELHDNIGSRMALLKNRLLNKLPEDQELHYEVKELYANVRSMSHELSPGDFKVLGLQQYLEMYLAQFQKATGVNTKLILHELPKLDTNLASQIFRIIQESVQNVQKHANASQLEIQIVQHDDELVLTIEDNGVGFDIHQNDQFASKGLSNIESRVHSLKGILELSSRVGHGTQIMVRLPNMESPS